MTSARQVKIGQRTNELIVHFDESVDAFEQAKPFTGPSIYFHYRTLERLWEHSDITEAIDDRYLLEYVYATLTSWGMHRMGRGGAKMPSFSAFATSLAREAERLSQLDGLELGQLADSEIREVGSAIWDAIEALDVSSSEAKLVAGTKTLHHLIPNLVPPMDRQYTARFFYGESGKTLYMGDQVAFMELFPAFARVARKCVTQAQGPVNQGGYMATTPLKVIDNAIVGFMISDS